MAQAISMKYKSDMTSATFNNLVAPLIGGNLVNKGFYVSPGTGKKISLLKNRDNINGLYINGAYITESTDLADVITIPDNTGTTDKLYLVYAQYAHGDGATCTYNITNGSTIVLPDSNCCLLAQVLAKPGFASSSDVAIYQMSRMYDFNEMRGILYGTPYQNFTIGRDMGDGAASQDGDTSKVSLVVNSSGQLEIKSGTLTTDTWVDIVVNNVIFKGTSTIINSNNVNIGDSLITLNADLPDNIAPTEDGGIEVYRGKQNSVLNAKARLYYNEAAAAWKAGLAGAEQNIVLANDIKLSKLMTASGKEGFLNWSYIDGKPSSSTSNIDDAVAKKHSQNTDYILTTDTGASQVYGAKVGSNVIEFYVKNTDGTSTLKASIDKTGNYNGSVSWSSILSGPTSAVSDIDDAVTKKHSQNTDSTITGGTAAATAKTTGTGNIINFLVGTTTKSSIDKDGNFTGSAAKVNGKSVDQNLQTTDAPSFTGITIKKDINKKSTIAFPAETNDPGYIEHYENNNTSTMTFVVSDDEVDTDYFSFGVSPSGAYKEKAKITGVGNMTLAGYINPTKGYNATFNDYAEWFLKGEDVEPGDVLAKLPGSNVYVKATESIAHLVVGVVSDEYAWCIGGDKLNNPEDNQDKYAPVGLAGRVSVKVYGYVEEGQFLVPSYIPGVALATWHPQLGTIIGKALESKSNVEVSKIRMMIKNA